MSRCLTSQDIGLTALSEATGDGPQGTWETDVFAYAWQRNETVMANDFTRGPLTYAEVTHLARSIARWTWRRTTRQTFRARQTALSKQGNEVRHAAARSRWENPT